MNWKRFFNNVLNAFGNEIINQPDEPVDNKKSIPPADNPALVAKSKLQDSKKTSVKKNKQLNLQPTDTQFSDLKDNADIQQLVIGLDFGTAFTKVIVGETRRKFAIPFTDAVKNKRYLMPARFQCKNNGDCTLHDDLQGEEITDLKMRLLNGNYDNENLANVTAYIALILQATRTYILSEKKSIYGGKRIVWLLNVGLPTDNYVDKELIHNYKIIMRLAWHVSCYQSGINRHKILSILNSNASDFVADEHFTDDAISLFPEFVAQMTGYVRSPSRQEDLHMLIDIGAGTVDFTVFNVYTNEDDDDIYPIFAKKVEKLGAAIFMKERLKSVPGENTADNISFINVLTSSEFKKNTNRIW